MMALSILRRATHITTSPAPHPAAGVDVAHTPQRPMPAGAAGPPVAVAPGSENGSAAADILPPAGRLAPPAPRPADPPPPLTTTAAHSSLPPGPPSWTPGRCYHVVHFDLDGHRYGVLPEPGDYPQRASLLRCPHLNQEGR